MILAGRVLVDEQKIEKPGSPVQQDAVLRLLGEEIRYVSRGGLKLEAALAHWQIDLGGRFCLDIGASTGGFTDCMLQHGASRSLLLIWATRLRSPCDLTPGLRYGAHDARLLDPENCLPVLHFSRSTLLSSRQLFSTPGRCGRRFQSFLRKQRPWCW